MSKRLRALFLVTSVRRSVGAYVAGLVMAFASPASALDFEDGGTWHFSTDKHRTPISATSDFVRYSLQCEALHPRTMKSYVEAGGDMKAYKNTGVQRCRLSFVSFQVQQAFAGDVVPDWSEFKSQLQDATKDRAKNASEVTKDLKKLESEVISDPLRARHQEQVVAFLRLLADNKIDEAIAYARKNTYTLCKLDLMPETMHGGMIFRRQDKDTWLSDREQVSCSDDGELRGFSQFFVRRRKGEYFYDLSNKKCGKPEAVWGFGNLTYRERPGLKCDTISW